METAKMSRILAQSPDNSKLMLIMDYMEKSWLPRDYCVKAIVSEIMKSLSLGDMLKLKQRYSNWIKEHHITYAAVLNNRMDMMIYYEAYVEKQTLVTPAIKSGNREMFAKVFTDTMNMFESKVIDNTLQKDKVNIKKNVWSWIDATVAAGNYEALAIILPRVKSIIAGVEPSRVTRFMKKTPVDKLRQVACVLEACGIDLSAIPNNYLQSACVYSLSDVIDKYADSLSTVHPDYIGMSADKQLMDRYLELFDDNVDSVLVPHPNGGILIPLASNLIGGALSTPHQDRLVDFLTYVFERFDINPMDVRVKVHTSQMVYGNDDISYPNMLALVKMGVVIIIDNSVPDRDERLSYLVKENVDTDIIIKVLSSAPNLLLGDMFVRSMLEKSETMLTLVISYAATRPNISLEITSATLLTILNRCSMIKAIIEALIEVNRFSVNDNLWYADGPGGAFNVVDNYRFNSLVNNLYEKYVINMLEVWKRHGVFVDNERFIWIAACCDFNYYGIYKNNVLGAIKELVSVRPDVATPTSPFEFIFQTRDYRYQSMLHAADTTIIETILSKNNHINYKFALKLAVENPRVFKTVFKLLPKIWHKDMFVVGGCLLNTATFALVFECLCDKNSLPDTKVIQRAITLFASHGKDETIKLVVEWGKGKIKINPYDIGLLSMRDRSDGLNILIKCVNDKHDLSLTVAYLIGAFRRRTETIMKLSTSGVKYHRLSIRDLLAQKIKEDEFIEPDIENKIRHYNQVVADIAQKTKLYDTLHSSILATIQYKPKQSKSL
jgi:hypothetical protein